MLTHPHVHRPTIPSSLANVLTLTGHHLTLIDLLTLTDWRPHCFRADLWLTNSLGSLPGHSPSRVFTLIHVGTSLCQSSRKDHTRAIHTKKYPSDNLTPYKDAEDKILLNRISIHKNTHRYTHLHPYVYKYICTWIHIIVSYSLPDEKNPFCTSLVCWEFYSWREISWVNLTALQTLKMSW